MNLRNVRKTAQDAIDFGRGQTTLNNFIDNPNYLINRAKEELDVYSITGNKEALNKVIYLLSVVGTV